jgi:hypothetical protein
VRGQAQRLCKRQFREVFLVADDTESRERVLPGVTLGDERQRSEDDKRSHRSGALAWQGAHWYDA